MLYGLCPTLYWQCGTMQSAIQNGNPTGNHTIMPYASENTIRTHVRDPHPTIPTVGGHPKPGSSGYDTMSLGARLMVVEATTYTSETQYANPTRLMDDPTNPAARRIHHGSNS